ESRGSALLRVMPSGRYFNQDTLRFARSDLPADLVSRVEGGGAGYQYLTVDDAPYMAFGVTIADPAANYFEVFPLATVERDLQIIATALAVGAATTALFAAGLGWWAARRLLRPLSHAADAASTLASGGLDTRLPPDPDPDLDRLARSFNGMADAVQARIQREARFASDVSHELRSPITALTAAVEVLDARRADLPDRSQQALDVVVNQVRRFDQMVLDRLPTCPDSTRVWPTSTGRGPPR
ncbi:MAG: HAMP domain-containing protein, partial [Ilumatobacteraceae bacterium]